MKDNKIIHLGQIWSGGEPDNQYWIGVSLGNVQQMGQPTMIGRQCRTLAELEAVASQIRDELDLVLTAMREKLTA